MAETEKESPPDPSADGRSVKEEKSAAQPRRSWKRVSCYWLLSVVAGVVAVLGYGLIHRMLDEAVERDEMLMRDIGEEGVALFNAYDRNGDGYLSLAEFEPLVDRLIGSENSSYTYDEEIDPSGEVIFVQALFQPLRQDTMSVEIDRWSYSQPDSTVNGLRDWQTVNLDIGTFGAGQFAAFLPDTDFSVGRPYTIISSNLNIFSSTLSSNRYFPPRASGKEVLIFKLLHMFHPRPFIHSRFSPQGSSAVLRAENEFYVSIVFRIHAEFQLNQPPLHPFWFTPAQFTGELIIRRDASHIKSFHLFVPTNKSLNVDMEWLNAPTEAENMEVDIGFLPQMELKATGPSIPVTITTESGDTVNILESMEPIELPPISLNKKPMKWNSEISFQEAVQGLEKHMYPFKQIPYLSYIEACKAAEVENKLVHLILLWGALDDQSC